MRFIHLADLHLGRSMAEFSLFELQKEFLTNIVHDITEKNIDAVVIAGDVYDRSLPSLHAVQLLNGFLSTLAAMKVPVVMISGNHDSAERLSFLSFLRLLRRKSVQRLKKQRKKSFREMTFSQVRFTTRTE